MSLKRIGVFAGETETLLAQVDVAFPEGVEPRFVVNDVPAHDAPVEPTRALPGSGDPGDPGLHAPLSMDAVDDASGEPNPVAGM